MQVHLAITHLQAGNVILAKIQFSLIEQAFPQNLWGILGQGLVYYDRHQWVKAEHIFQHLVRVYPDDDNSLAALARVLIKLDKKEECQAILEASSLTSQSVVLSEILNQIQVVLKDSTDLPLVNPLDLEP